MDNRPIGVFDSGLGGLTLVKELHRIMPQEDIIYLGDTARIPYGSRSRETIVRYAREDMAFLQAKDVKMIAAACGTVSSTLTKEVTSRLGMPYVDVILPTAQAACALTAHGKIGVIGTAASMRSNAYGKTIRNIRGDVRVFGNACPLLVHLVENGMIEEDNQITRLTVEMYLKPLIAEGIDTLILGCTHYPIIYPIFNSVLDYKVTLVDPGKVTARYIKNMLSKEGMLCSREENGTTEYNVTDQPQSFEQTATLFLGEAVGQKVNEVRLKPIEG